MSVHFGVAAARLHAVPVARPRSAVFHLYAGPLTPTGRQVPRAARSVANCRTRRLYVLPRDGVVLDLGGRRLCGRCAARLESVARRTSAAPARLDDRASYWAAAGITSVDLVVALAMAATEDETFAIGGIANALFGRVETSLTPRPQSPGKTQGRWDFEDQLLRTRNRLRSSARTPDEVAADAMRREIDADMAVRAAAARKKAAAMDRAIDRRNRGAYLMPHERELFLSSA